MHTNPTRPRAQGRRNSRIKLAFGALFWLAPLTAGAQEADGPAQEQISFRNPDDIPNLIEDANEEQEGKLKQVVPKRITNSWDAFKERLSTKYGFDFSLAYGYVIQGAASRTDDGFGSGGQGEFDFTWTFFGRKGGGMKSLIGGKLEDRHAIGTEIPPQLVAPRTGSLWTGAVGFGELNFTASQLWLEHHFIRDRVLARIGKISPFTVFDYYKFKSPRVGFLGQVQNFNPTIAFPPSALGLGAGTRLPNGGFIAAGTFDANGVAQRDGFDTLFRDGELFTIAEIGWTPDFNILLRPGVDYRPGNDDYHVTVWHADGRRKAGIPEGWGVTASAQKGFGNIVPFLRYGYSNGGATPLEHLVSAGVGFEDFMGFKDDVMAASFAFGRPSNPLLRDQYAIEWFYRMQITPAFQLSPDFQFIINPALDPDADILLVLSARARIAF